jgi:SAM-dependent methyltransferase
MVASKWSALEPDVERNFFGFPHLRRHMVRLAFGDTLAEKHGTNRWWAEDIFIETQLGGRDVRNILSLCCGFGLVERYFRERLGPGVRCLGLDVAPGAIAAARERAAAAGLGDALTYELADLNTYDFGAPRYDLVIANGALHHLSRLEYVLSGIHGALKPGGILYANETVGASLQDHTPRQLELINAAAYLVPPELRSRRPAAAPVPGLLPAIAYSMAAFVTGTRDAPFRFSPVHFSQKRALLRSDPSEGVRSAEIVDAVRAAFGDVAVHPYGGGILTYALDEAFYRGYDNTNPRHRDTLEMLCDLEARLMACGELATEHAILVARRTS